MIQPHKRRLPWRKAWLPHERAPLEELKRLPVTHREDVLASQTTTGMMMSGFGRRLRSAFGKDSIKPADPFTLRPLSFSRSFFEQPGQGLPKTGRAAS